MWFFIWFETVVNSVAVSMHNACVLHAALLIGLQIWVFVLCEILDLMI